MSGFRSILLLASATMLILAVQLSTAAEWKCYGYSTDDTTWRDNNHATEKQMCERTGGRKFNGGDKSIAEQCGNCWCCKPAKPRPLGSALKGYCSKTKGKIEILARPPQQIEVNLGERVSIVCAAHGHGMADPNVYWVKGLGPGFEDKGEHMGPVAVGKSVLYIEKVQLQHIDTYRCVVEDCCSDKKEEMDIDIHVPDETCKNKYGEGNLVYGATWQFKNWTSAVQSCRDKGLEIAFPRNMAENVQLLKDIQASFTTHPNARKYSHENWVWIGAHDQVEEDVWRLAETEEKVKWFNWQKGQPDNWTMDEKLKNGQDCIGIRRTNGKWDDSFVHYERPYVCMCRNNEEKKKKKDDGEKKKKT